MKGINQITLKLYNIVNYVIENLKQNIKNEHCKSSTS